MIIIYNRSGLIVGLAGLGAGVLVALAAQRLSPGLATVAAIWFFAGRRWTRLEADGVPRYPSLYFVPLRFASLLVCLLAVSALIFEGGHSQLPPDPIADMRRADENQLRYARISGNDEALAQSVYDSLRREINDCSVNVHVASHGVLILARVADLQKFDVASRTLLLNLMQKPVEAREDLAARPLYLGLRGKILYGGLRVPLGKTETGSSTGTAELEPFYRPFLLATTKPAQ